MSTKTEASSGGIGFCGLLAILFIGLKLCGVIDWSWIWVLCPLWIGLAVGIAFLALSVVVALIAVAIAAIIGAFL